MLNLIICFKLCLLVIVTPISVAAENDTRIVCVSKGLFVDGIKINMSEILNIECLEKATFVTIYALDTFLIDDDFNKTGTIAQLMVIAPKWEVIGSRKIILDGPNAQQLKPDYAPSGIGKFKDGKPGKPGGSGGSFLGFGSEFINDANLEIHVNGGIGGFGQYGGNGMKKSTILSNV